MKTIGISGVVVILVSLASFQLFAQGYKTMDTVYTPAGYPEGPLQATIYIPDSSNGIGVVLAHWWTGTRQTPHAWCEAFAANGYVAMTIDYHDYDDTVNVRYPRPIRAYKTAVEFLRRNTARFGISTGKIVGFGQSEGSNHWGEAITEDNDDTFLGTDPRVDDRVDAAILMYGMYDNEHFLQSILDVNGILVNYFADYPNYRATKGNCIANVDSIHCPVLLFHGPNDDVLQYQQSLELRDSMAAHRMKVELLSNNSWGHGFDVDGPNVTFTAQGLVARDSVFAFLRRELQQSPPTAGLQLWLRSDAGLDTLNGKVSRWHDQSGKGNDAIQLNTVRQPLFVRGELNQKPVLRFDGFDDKLGFTGTTPMSQFTLFMVVKNYSGGAEHNSHVITFGPFGGSPTQGFAVLWGGFDRVPGLILFGNSNGGMFASAPNIAANGEWRIISIVFQTRFNTTLRWNGNNATMSVNEPGPSFFGPLGDPTGSGGGIGGADGVPLLTAKCDFAEAIVYDTLLTDSQRLAIEQYLNGKYNILTSQAILSVDTRPVDLRMIDNTLLSRDTTFMVKNIGGAEDSIDVSLDYGNVTPDSAISVSPMLFALPSGDSAAVTFTIRPPLLIPQYYSAVVRVQSRFGSGPTLLSKPMLWQIVPGTDVLESDELPEVFALNQNYPNPFNPSTTIKYELPKTSMVRLSVFDVLGREMSVLVNERKDAGAYEVKFDASGFASGVYLYRLSAGSFVETRKLVLVR